MLASLVAFLYKFRFPIATGLDLCIVLMMLLLSAVLCDCLLIGLSYRLKSDYGDKTRREFAFSYSFCLLECG